MKILIIDTYYSDFLKNVRKHNRSLINKCYSIQKKYLIEKCFGTSDFYSYNLNKLGHKSIDIIANDEILQRQWAKENNIKVERSGFFSKFQSLPFVHKFIGRPNWIQTIALAQIKKEHPDVLYMQDLSILNPDTLRKAKKYTKLIVGQIACPLPAKENLKEFDLIITSFPHYVNKFRKMGIKSEYLKLCFEPRILKKIGQNKKIYDISFVGSFTPQHLEGTKMLEKLAKKLPVNVWGRGGEYILPNSPIKKYYHGEAWGLDMYKIFSQSKIVINRHIDVAENYANNMRLYEASGVGALILTDKKVNISDMFEVNNEIVEYSDSKDLIDKARYYLKKSTIRDKIAKNGQKRTLDDHSYFKRMNELIKILQKYV